MLAGILGVDAQTTSARAHSRDAGVLGWRQTRRAAHPAVSQLWSGLLLSASVLPALLVEGRRVVHGERPREAAHLRHLPSPCARIPGLRAVRHRDRRAR